jgi:excisionase family DNA binding protein
MLQDILGQPEDTASVEHLVIAPGQHHKSWKRGSDFLLKPKEAAERLGCSIKTLLRHAKDGSIRYINVGKGLQKLHRRFDPTDIEDFKDKRRRQEVSLCQSTSARTRRTTTSTSKCEVIGFTALRDARAAAKLKR